MMLSLRWQRGHGHYYLVSEAQEIIRLCDRALVMYQGHIQGSLRQYHERTRYYKTCYRGILNAG